MVVSLVYYSDVLVTLKHHMIRQHSVGHSSPMWAHYQTLVNSRTLSTRPRPRPRTIEIVLEDPRGQGHVLEDSITDCLWWECCVVDSFSKSSYVADVTFHWPVGAVNTLHQPCLLYSAVLCSRHGTHGHCFTPRSVHRMLDCLCCHSAVGMAGNWLRTHTHILGPTLPRAPGL